MLILYTMWCVHTNIFDLSWVVLKVVIHFKEKKLQNADLAPTFCMVVNYQLRKAGENVHNLFPGSCGRIRTCSVCACGLQQPLGLTSGYRVRYGRGASLSGEGQNWLPHTRHARRSNRESWFSSRMNLLFPNAKMQEYCGLRIIFLRNKHKHWTSRAGGVSPLQAHLLSASFLLTPVHPANSCHLVPETLAMWQPPQAFCHSLRIKMLMHIL